MKIFVKDSKARRDITELVARVTWSGSYSQVARKLDITVASSTTDYYLPKVNVELGNIIELRIGNTVLFQGYVFVKTRTGKGDALEITAYDSAIYLLKNKASYNFKKTTAERIAAGICADFGIPAGEFAGTGIIQSFIPIGETCYDIIMKAYNKASEQNGKKYMVIMDDNKLSVIQKGSLAIDYVLYDSRDITDSTYSESLEDMINTVKIVDANGNVSGTVIEAEWVKAFGRLEDVYQKEEGTNPAVAAKAMLHGVARTGTVNAVGNVDCITGYLVGIKDIYSDTIQGFVIDSDTHTWENGAYTMQLELNFDEVMDENTFVSKKKKKSSDISKHWDM
ncbi:XkdQ/YqbQ family protein [Ruminiclostridium cellobioparum]|uniref:XkdQ/YqbQ family protein n=1 Tax=Ruminiclostridium cellobioparum TaxID=29355 RepID=UPI00048806E1|nr:hypothetical protein [Ruminiclostridium cellobioparum]